MKQVRRLSAWTAFALAGAALLGTAGCPGEDGSCELDTDCASERVCARSHECLLPAQVRLVRVSWTIRGTEATKTNCAPVDPLTIQFAATREDTLKFEPLDCGAGVFTIDKMPSRMTTVTITGPQVAGSSGIPADGKVQMDLR